jgi:beta-galactosidase
MLGNKFLVSIFFGWLFFFNGLHSAGQARLPDGRSRTMISINDGWEFVKGDNNTASVPDQMSAAWQNVRLPHTWNATDIMDDNPGYYRGIGWYRKKLWLNASDTGRLIYLRLEGANQSTTVFVNGQIAGTHTGGYTAFQFPIQALVRFGASNDVLIKVDNKYDPDIPPLTADFSFFGGIYRDAWLIKTNSTSFSLDNKGSNGVFISTPAVSAEKASINIRATINKASANDRRVIIRSVILDEDHNAVESVEKQVSLPRDGESDVELRIPSFKKPRLWSPDDPYLYSVVTTIHESRSGRVVDEVINPLGFRWFHFDADKGFFLNGKPLKLIGTSRHQDRPGHANALKDDIARQDINLLKQMGGNFLRIAHYPQDPSVFEACDKLGILTSVEIPVVNEITESAAFYQHCEDMQVEMIRQQYNHPSVIIWCYMNEILLRPHYNDDRERQQIYFANITRLAKRLDSITRKEDPYRNTMIANHGDFEKYRKNGLTDFPDIIGWNLYSGWYGGKLEDFPAFMEKHHAQLPNKPMVIAEFGADADPRIRSFDPVRFDKSIEYTLQFHQYYYQEIMKRPFVAAAMIWNLADFNSETREESMPHINNKGLLAWDRTPKDIYYWYKAMLTKEPFIRIASASWPGRTGIADSADGVCYQPLQVTGNMDSVELIVNGQSMGWSKPDCGLCEWNVPFIDGKNSILAKGRKSGMEYTDQVNINFNLQPWCWDNKNKKFSQLNILLGARRFFYDNETGIVWQPDQPYRVGSWGHIGGVPYTLPGNSRLTYGTDKSIMGTDNDPVYQTQQIGIDAYRLDVPKGNYELTLHFAEIENAAGKILPYNLAPSANAVPVPDRCFNVFIDGKIVLENLDITKQYGLATAVAQKILVTADRGINISFSSVKGKPVLNALQLRKLN